MDTIKTLVLQEDQSRDFILSSPTNGKKTDEEGYVANDPSSPLYGDGKILLLLSLRRRRMDRSRSRKFYVYFQVLCVVHFHNTVAGELDNVIKPKDTNTHCKSIASQYIGQN